VVYIQESKNDLSIDNDPVSFSKAINCDNSDKWLDAMKDELKSMSQNDIWDLVKLPKGCRELGVNGSLRLNVTLIVISNIIRTDLLLEVLLRSRDDNGTGRGRVSLSHTHPRRKNPSSSSYPIQRVSNFCLILIPTRKRV